MERLTRKLERRRAISLADLCQLHRVSQALAPLVQGCRMWSG